MHLFDVNHKNVELGLNSRQLPSVLQKPVFAARTLNAGQGIVIAQSWKPISRCRVLSCYPSLCRTFVLFPIHFALCLFVPQYTEPEPNDSAMPTQVIRL